MQDISELLSFIMPYSADEREKIRQKRVTGEMKKGEFMQGIRHGIPICLGYFSVSFAFGMTAVIQGLPLWAAVLISLTNVTSAGQFAGFYLMIDGGSAVELVMTTLIINIRYFLMSLSISQKVEEKMTMRQRCAVSFGITDEIFAGECSIQKH